MSITPGYRAYLIVVAVLALAVFCGLTASSATHQDAAYGTVVSCVVH